MGSLLIVTGPPGAGKSAVAAHIGGRLVRSAVVAGDSFFGFLVNGKEDPWLPAAHGQNETVVRAAAAATSQFVRGGYETVYDGVLGPWFLPIFADAVGLERFDYVILMPPVEVCAARVSARKDHELADGAAAQHMHRDFANADIDSRHVVRKATASVGETADLVLSARESGALIYNRH